MTLTRLSLTDFRNHAAADMAAGPGLVALHGDNGAGKTNLLEAISLLAPGRGLRRAALAATVRDGANGGFAVFAEVQAGADLSRSEEHTSQLQSLMRSSFADICMKKKNEIDT